MMTLKTELIAEIEKLQDEPGQVPMQNERLLVQGKKLLRESKDLMTKLESLLSSFESLKTQYGEHPSELMQKYGPD